METETKVMLGLFIGVMLICTGGFLISAYDKYLVSHSPAPLEMACAFDGRHVACTILAGRK